ncbi:MAG: hypothetical protein HY508_00995 [Acidobacteria bacterium]|nr:hypothetical protein [Acidobacteriota bacterium]
MKIGEHGLRDHLRLLAPLFGLIGAVWALRWIADIASAPPGLVRGLSVSVAGAVSVLVAVILIHFKRFGGYASVVVSAFLLVVWEEMLIALAIVVRMATGVENIYTIPEFGFGETPLQHIAGHFTYGLGFEGITAAAMGCALLWVLRRLVPPSPLRSSSGRHIIQHDSSAGITIRVDPPKNP